MLEKDIEKYMRVTLQRWGFRFLKFTSPGNTGVMDRIILYPTYSPRPPEFVEIKQPKGHEATKQAILRHDFRCRGVIVHEPVWCMDDAKLLCLELVSRVRPEYERLHPQ
jgi:hypothetical protein